MAEVVQDTEQEFWRSQTGLGPITEAALPAASFAPEATEMAEACAECGTEFMIGARFCHTCGRRRPVLTSDTEDAAVVAGVWARSISWTVAHTRSRSAAGPPARRQGTVPQWQPYLHFHGLKSWL